MGKSKLMSDGELNDVGNWNKKAQTAKGGFVTHTVGDVSRIKKSCCDKYMGDKCSCKRES